jgi:hypothetical protein
VCHGLLCRDVIVIGLVLALQTTTNNAVLTHNITVTLMQCVLRKLQYSAWVQSAGRTQALRSHCTASSNTPATAAAATAAAAQQQSSLALDYPSWFFLSHLSAGAKSLLSFLLHPDPRCRPSVKQAQAHPWLQPAAATVSAVAASSISSSVLDASAGSLSELVEVSSDDGESLCDDVTDDVAVVLPTVAATATGAASVASTGSIAAVGTANTTAAVDADVSCAAAVAGLIGECVHCTIHSKIRL